ncbi:DUF3014 domain-containing protein [Variovorax guangxiensis]|uniref:DUF3014 domain-containing protein n=1 Tax=Variovorax guangxiensis TaxID=1775474 RepID=A0A502E3C8_9BURK|nr:DUF3014 domain-containing protein [Variovorax guangxiensis]TPG27212.1 DUF3014 domain-containing protein [Variovorax ginsengisoli]TPG30940.1 DUF3014 domain-containing protein [Variovorax guangxiensis]
MSDREPADFRPARSSSFPAVAIVVLIALIAAGGWWYWSQRAEPPPSRPTVASPPPPESPAPAPQVAASGPQNPVDALAEPDAVLPALAEADAAVTSALTELLGAKRVASFLNVDGFVRRAVATVDNLPRPQAASRMWPVQPSPERFLVQGTGEQQVIGAGNAARYAAFTGFVEAVDAERAATVYARLYPLFQQAYEELGYPGRYFNDRLVAVIDHLLAAPEPAGPIAVRLTEVRGEFADTRPWTRYEFADPALESLSSGQKMMVRVGLSNEKRLKAKLRTFRAQVATGELAKR